MTEETFKIIAAVVTVFEFIGTGGLANAVWRYWCIWREPETQNKALAFAMLIEHLPFFLGYLLRFLFTMYLWLNDGIVLANSTPGAAWRGLVTWFILMIGGIFAGGISRGWFSPKRKKELYP